MVKWLFYSFFPILSLHLCLSPFLASPISAAELSSGRPSEKYSNEELPIIVFAYSIFCARYDSFKCLESNSVNPLVKLDKNIELLGAGIPLALAFTHIAFTVQNNIIGHQSGFLRIKNRTLEESGVPFERILFVTTPLESFKDRTLVILSAVSPEYTTIFSVDNKLNVGLLYDKTQKKEVTNLNGVKDTISIGSVYGIQVVRPGYFLLQERMEPGGYAFPHLFSRYENREFIIDVTKGDFRMGQRK